MCESLRLINLMGECLSSLTIKELKQVENRLERGISRIRSKKVKFTASTTNLLLADIEFLQKKEKELDHENSFLRAKIAEVDRLQQLNMLPNDNLDLVHPFLQRDPLLTENMLQDCSEFTDADKKILHLR
ncbi:agamous-like MADS-box protein AGL11 [Beta vulgaris subsp. vulgaris]|uniref:agamous-like MADS-box protein AGL11 n=1 Tax=Beta vulgaris subsp. vulgaris TaxID=3555 RepID=UPI002546BECB|nr:agamous-like MADS-box protein AGL11 [Beta vulgaris subsp. vulgaris]